MSASPSVDDSFTFVGGLYTEGSFFLTPKNSWKEGDNVVPSIDGSIRVRPSINFEENFQQNTSLNLTTDDLNNYAFTVETWTSVGGNGNLDFFVVQQGPFIEFYRAFTGTVGAGKVENSTIDLRDYSVFGNDSYIGSNVITVASCYGRLLITSIDTDPILVQWNPDTEVLTHGKVTVNIRDFEGIPSPAQPWEEYSYAEWEASLQFGDEAKYNLYNQGWTDFLINGYAFRFDDNLPANTKVWWYGKNPDGDFDADLLAKNDFGSSLAPKGKFILEAFYQERAKAVNGYIPGTSTTPVTEIPPIRDNSYQDRFPPEVSTGGE